MSDLSDLTDFASLSLQQAASSPTSEGHSSGGSESERSAAASTPSTSPSAGPTKPHNVQHLNPSNTAFLAENQNQVANAAGEPADYDTEGPLQSKIHTTGEHRRSNGTRGSRQIDPTERRTVFIPNLPRDATHRELTNMFAFCDGFVKVQLYDQKEGGGAANSGAATPPTTSRPASNNGGADLTFFGAFILFDTPAQACFARDRLHGLVFDTSVQPPTILQARLALKNLFLTREEHEQHLLMQVANNNNNNASSQKTSRRGSHGFASQQLHSQVIPPQDGYMTVAANHNGVGGGGAHSFSPLLSPQPAGGVYVHSGYHSPALSPYGATQHQQLTPPAIQQQAQGYYSDPNGVMSPQQLAHPQGVFSGMYNNVGNVNNNGGYHRHGNNHGYHNNNHHSHPHSHAGPFNPPCSTLFLARLDQLSDEELYSLLINSFPESLKDTKFMIDSKNQRIAFVEFDCIDNAALALQRISGYCGISCAFSKNPLNKKC